MKTPPLEWGREHEEDGYRLFTNIYTGGGVDPKTPISGLVFYVDDKQHQNAEVKKSGFVIDKEEPWMGASPDGLISCSCCGKGVLEIKCPFKHRNTPMPLAMQDSSFCLGANLQLVNKHYTAQLQLLMHVLDVQFADLMVWTTVDAAVVRVKRDERFVQDIETMKTLWSSHVLPELVSRKSQCPDARPSTSTAQPDLVSVPDVTVQPSSSAVSSKVFCLCKTTDDSEDMAGCDRCDDWFHPDCVVVSLT